MFQFIFIPALLSHLQESSKWNVPLPSVPRLVEGTFPVLSLALPESTSPQVQLFGTSPFNVLFSLRPSALAFASAILTRFLYIAPSPLIYPRYYKQSRTMASHERSLYVAFRTPIHYLIQNCQAGHYAGTSTMHRDSLVSDKPRSPNSKPRSSPTKLQPFYHRSP